MVSSPDRTDLDLVYEILIKMGLDLTSQVVSDERLYIVDGGVLMIYLGDVSDTSIAQKMVDLHQKLEPFVWRAVFKDSSFATDDIKANTRETLKMAGLQEGSFITL